MQQTASWRGVLPWLMERFPPGPYTLLVLCFWASAVSVAGALGGGDHHWAPLSAVLVWLVFLHLRIFDEHKDFESDRVAYPQRVLSRGEVSLGTLEALGMLVVGLEVGLAWLLGAEVLLAWVLTYTFTFLMRHEFGMGRLLRRSMVAYAITHNPVVAGLAVVLFAASGATWTSAFLWYVLLVSVGSLGFEVGRKTRREGEEHRGVESYTSQLGQVPARVFLGVLHLGTGAALLALVLALGWSPWVAALAGVGVVSPGLVTLGARAERVELGASATLLLAMAASGLLAAWAP